MERDSTVSENDNNCDSPCERLNYHGQQNRHSTGNNDVRNYMIFKFTSYMSNKYLQ